MTRRSVIGPRSEVPSFAPSSVGHILAMADERERIPLSPNTVEKRRASAKLYRANKALKRRAAPAATSQATAAELETVRRELATTKAEALAREEAAQEEAAAKSSQLQVAETRASDAEAQAAAAKAHGRATIAQLKQELKTSKAEQLKSASAAHQAHQQLRQVSAAPGTLGRGARQLLATVAPLPKAADVPMRKVLRSELQIGEQIGEGGFGSVSKARWCGSAVAVNQGAASWPR